MSETTEYKASLDDIVAGDIVVQRDRSDCSPLSFVKVDRVTKTQIIIGTWRYRKKNGKEIGGTIWHRSWIYAPLATGYAKMTYAEQAREAQAEHKAEMAKRPLINYIKENVNRQRLLKLSQGELEVIAKKLGYEGG